jgi:hypothetical protein
LRLLSVKKPPSEVEALREGILGISVVFLFAYPFVASYDTELSKNAGERARGLDRYEEACRLFRTVLHSFSCTVEGENLTRLAAAVEVVPNRSNWTKRSEHYLPLQSQCVRSVALS